MSFFCPHASMTLRILGSSPRTGLRQTPGGTMQSCCWSDPDGAENRRSNKRVHLDDGKSFWVKKDSSGDATQLLKCCALPTWWSWRGTCTRSHSEHGREMPLRLWYSVLRRGRVGRCQVCKTQHNLINMHRQTSTQSRPKPTNQYRLQQPKRKQHDFPRGGAAR